MLLSIFLSAVFGPPSLKATVIQVPHLLHTQQGDQLEILEDDLEDEPIVGPLWVLARNPRGEEGYVFSDYLHSEPWYYLPVQMLYPPKIPPSRLRAPDLLFKLRDDTSKNMLELIEQCLDRMDGAIEIKLVEFPSRGTEGRTHRRFEAWFESKNKSDAAKRLVELESPYWLKDIQHDIGRYQKVRLPSLAVAQVHHVPEILRVEEGEQLQILEDDFLRGRRWVFARNSCGEEGYIHIDCLEPEPWQERPVQIPHPSHIFPCDVVRSPIERSQSPDLVIKTNDGVHQNFLEIELSLKQMDGAIDVKLVEFPSRYREGRVHRKFEAWFESRDKANAAKRLLELEHPRWLRRVESYIENQR